MGPFERDKDLIAMLSHWGHSGFQVFCGQRTFPRDETAMENPARRIIRASFSRERMQYFAEPSKVVYRAKNGTDGMVFDDHVSSTGQALEWLAAMCSHIPDRGEQMVRYYEKLAIMRSFDGRTREFAILSRRCSILRFFESSPI